jgi:hypothetical protein
MKLGQGTVGTGTQIVCSICNGVSYVFYQSQENEVREVNEGDFHSSNQYGLDIYQTHFQFVLTTEMVDYGVPQSEIFVI